MRMIRSSDTRLPLPLPLTLPQVSGLRMIKTELPPSKIGDSTYHVTPTEKLRF
jgi:hypothetical protein